MLVNSVRCDRPSSTTPGDNGIGLTPAVEQRGIGDQRGG